MKELKKLETELRFRHYSPNTIRAYTKYNRMFLKFVRKKSTKINRKDIKKFVFARMNDDNISHSTARLMVASLMFFYNEVMDREFPMIKMPNRARRFPTVLMKWEVKKFIKSIKNRQYKLLIKLIYSSGLRINETLNLKVQDIDFRRGVGIVRCGKGGKDRLFIIAKSLKRELKNHVREKDKNDYIFNTSRGSKFSYPDAHWILCRLREKANLRKVTFHSLRHSFAVHLLEDDVDIVTLQQLLGHAWLQSTSYYAQLSSRYLKRVTSPLDNL